mmetsp:Transcript_27306/g.54670  ORF Transcript_27306/g.54670 Transcript_27306/m.54670 type:complete len:82 (-) Transcript_27306:118-363(-)
MTYNSMSFVGLGQRDDFIPFACRRVLVKNACLRSDRTTTSLQVIFKCSRRFCRTSIECGIHLFLKKALLVGKVSWGIKYSG